MKSEMLLALLAVVIIGVAGHIACSRAASARTDASPVRERVELVTYRTRKAHDGCASNGYWQATGKLRKVEAYGIDKPVWAHKCDGCGEEREFWDEQWPKFEREWQVVR
jgi:hypothetical protein